MTQGNLKLALENFERSILLKEKYFGKKHSSKIHTLQLIGFFNKYYYFLII